MKKEVLVNGRKVAYFEEGQGPSFLIIHGWGPRLVQHFLAFQRKLASRQCRVILLALPGSEDGGDLPSGWGIKEYVAYISDFTDALDLKDLFLIGHSMGGAMTIRLAVEYPDRIKALILFSPGIFRSIKSHSWQWRIFLIGFNGFLIAVKFIIFLLSFILKILKKLLFVFAPRLRHPLRKAFNKVGGWLANWELYRQFLFQGEKIMCDILKYAVGFEDTVSYLPKVRHPALILWGKKKDFNYYLSFGDFFTKRIPNHEIWMVPNEGHNIQDSEKTIELIMDFIKRIESQGTLFLLIKIR